MSTDVIRGFTLNSLLSIAEMNAQTQSLKIRSKGRVGHLFIENGELIGAETFEMSGESAAIEIINWDESEIEIINIGLKSSDIRLNLMKLILEAEAVKEARDEKADEIESMLLSQALTCLDSFHYKESRDFLTRLLKKNPRHGKGWLAYSRTTGKVKTIDYALTKAIGLMPENPEIINEFEKFCLLKKRLTGETLRRCPFCRTPNLLSDPECSHCRAFMTINLPSLNDFKENADTGILLEAKNLFSLLSEKENNPHLHYCLGLYYFNTQNWKKALDELNEAAALSNSKPFYSGQLSALVRLVSSKETSVKTKPAKRETLPLPKTGSGENSRLNRTIMVVEDSSTMRKVISIALNNQGKYRIIEATDGLEALSRLHSETPDLILLDIILPRMNGYEILSILKSKREFKEIPVIMLTSRDGLVNKMKGKIAGASAYLTKPFKPEVLIRTIEKHLPLETIAGKGLIADEN